jgi:hypothetical protein
MSRRISQLLGALALSAALAACGTSAASGNSVVQPTLPLSGLPGAAGSGGAGAAGTSKTTTTFAPSQQVAANVTGNRVITIGDSVMASTSRRYSNDMCNALVPLGWQVEVDAETGRFIPFGNKVLDSRLSAGWDAAVILLGNNYGEQQDAYRTELERMIQRLSPRPIVLLTVTEFKPSRAQVNAVIREMAQKYSNIMVVDWATTTADNPGYTGGDRLHLTTDGRRALAENVALALGEAPVQPGACLTTSFTDDSSGPVTGTNGTYRPVQSSVPVGTRVSTTTALPGTTPGGGTTSVTTTQPAPPPPTQVTTVPPTTLPPVTTATTAPPTLPPTTAPPKA